MQGPFSWCSMDIRADVSENSNDERVLYAVHMNGVTPKKPTEPDTDTRIHIYIQYHLLRLICIIIAMRRFRFFLILCVHVSLTSEVDF